MKRAKHIIQFSLLFGMAVHGFFFTYSQIWFICGLPDEWWSSAILALLACLSTWGLEKWIEGNGEDEKT